MGKIKQQAGFSAVEGLIVILVLLILGGTGYFVWHRHNSTNENKTAASHSTVKSNVRNCHTTDGSIRGELFTDGNGMYSICIPDGWDIAVATNGVNSLMADASGLHYKAGTTPTITKTTEGKDGPSAFDLFPSSPSAAIGFNADQYTNLGSFKAANVTGTKSTRIETSQSADGGLGEVPVGTHQYTYIFNSAKLQEGVEIDYNIAPGDSNQLSLIDKVVATFRFNQ